VQVVIIGLFFEMGGNKMYNHVMAVVNIDETQKMLDEIAEKLPKEFFKELNGGILLLPEIKRSPHAKKNDLYILGEYVRNSSMGRMIYIYYGSFQRLFGNMEREDFRRRLKETLLHEFTHHLESLAGERGLEKKDEEKLIRYMENKKI